jgi:hypothetical protein
MAMDLVDVAVGSFWSKVSGGLKNVIKFVGKSGLAKKVGDKVLVSTTAGTASLDALKPATQLIESAKAGDETAKAQVAALQAKADAGDQDAQKTMGVLDIAAAGLRAAEQKTEVVVGKQKRYKVRTPDGKTMTFRDKAQYQAWLKKKLASKSNVKPSGQPGNQLVNRQQIAQRMQGMTSQQQQVFQQNLLAQQQQNLQSGMFQGYDQYGQPIGTSGYGYPQTGYPQTGYPGGYGVPMQQGFPGSYVQQEQFADEPPPELMQTTQPDDVEIEELPDEGGSE